MELCHEIYQNCRGLRILPNTIDPTNFFSHLFISAARLLFSFVLQFLLKSGKGRSLVEEYDKYENTPLHVAAKKGYVRIVQVSSYSRVSVKAATGPKHPGSSRNIAEHQTARPPRTPLIAKIRQKSYKTPQRNLKNHVPGMFRKCSRVFWGVPGLFLVLQTPLLACMAGAG